MHILVIGIGLIGGSLIKALKPLKDIQVMGIDCDEKILKQCQSEGYLDTEYSDIEKMKKADLIYMCLYPDATLDFLRIHQNEFKTGALITDVAGLKENMINEINTFLRQDIHFIGGHPMAGREGVGYQYSSANIFIDANYLLIRSESASQAHYERLENVIRNIGCKNIEYLEPREHDQLIAYTSHMPHLLASLLVNCNRYDKTKNCIAGSFNDITRVANINASLWSELFISNSESLLEEIRHFQKALQNVESALMNQEKTEIEAILSDVQRKKVLLTSQF